MALSYSSLTFLLLTIITNSLFSTPSLAGPRASTSNRPRTHSSLSVRDGEYPCVELFAASDLGAQFVQYYKDTLQFQSTLAYLKNPPPSYQQPPADILSALDFIRAGIDTGVFENEYDFEAAVQNVIHASHDGHIYLNAGAFSVFSFGSEYAISSVSVDGIEPPKVYLTEHLVDAQMGSTNGKPSPIRTINDKDVAEWLTDFAAVNSFGLLEPNADWNALMSSPAADIQGQPSVFTGQSPFYPGDTLEFVLEDGTKLSTQWLSLVTVPYDTPPINNGQDIYNFFVVNDVPTDDYGDPPPSSSSSSSSSAPSTTNTTPTSSDEPSVATDTPTPSFSSDAQGWGIPAYPPSPDVSQPDLGFGGFVTGYFLHDSSRAVLSIPSFEMTGSAISSFSVTIGDFLIRSKKAGLTKIVIDLQQNTGGEVLLAIDAFKQFFPPIEPFRGSRLRSFDYPDALGTIYTQYASRTTLNQTYTDAFVDIPWAVLGYLNAYNNQNFTSWPEFFGPHADHGDLFSTVQRDNLSSSLFDEVATGGYLDDGITPAGIVIYGYGNRSTSTPPPFAADDVILLTDSICHSACAVFVEMMSHQAGVRTVVVGGRPNIGPMQAVAGTRGALAYNTAALDNDIYAATVLNPSVANRLPHSHVANDLAFWITFAQINLRDQIRSGEYFPLQFAYEAADCRIYWTMSSFNNFTELWEHAADAIWKNSALCVKDSQSFPSTSGTNILGPSDAQKASWAGIGSEQPQTTVYNPSTQASPIPVSEYSVGQLQAMAPVAPVYHYSSSAPNVSYMDPSQDRGIAMDDLPPLHTTLDQHCDLSQRSFCMPRALVCREVSFCDDGRIQFDSRCKQQCTNTNQCDNDKGGRTFCNVQDKKCTYDTNGTLNCNSSGGAQHVVGSGSRRTTRHVQAPGAQAMKPLSGFCEPVVRVQPACQRFIAKSLPMPAATLAYLASSGINTLVAEAPASLEEMAHAVQLASAGETKAQDTAKGSIGGFVNAMWGP